MVALKDFYNENCVSELTKEFGYENVMQVPKLEKISLNMGLGEAVQNPKIIESATNELTDIAGQRAVVTKARKSIAGFKLREGQAIGCRVTLRGDKMYEFLNKLINVALPRVRDFRGIKGKGFDGRGNFSFGITEHIIFPEVDYDKIDKIKGLNITINTSAKTNEEGYSLLKKMGMPFNK
ncbi:MAG: 50S ribosomal protein L5 [Desulfobulbaceae bacterium]|jgi:large subunit ribosomal protein L5|nr:50S ribosomal protein L5 [Desulfobulbaceae bacterium]